MRIAGRLILLAFLLLLTGLAVVWSNPVTGTRTAQLTQDQEKLCLTCHSPRAPPNDTAHEHIGVYDPMGAGSPCYVCHGPVSDPNGETPTHNPANVDHPTPEEATAMGKDIMSCDSCHYKHDIQQELSTGGVAPPPPASALPAATTLALMIVAGVSLITGVSMIAVLFSVRRRSTAKG
jgi:hypothetical protein